MARALSIYNNFIAPAGILILKQKALINKKEYKKVWSPFWDIVINKGKEDISEEEKKLDKNWTWCGVYRNKVKFHVVGDNILNFIESPKEPKVKDVYVIGKKKRKKK